DRGAPPVADVDPGAAIVGDDRIGNDQLVGGAVAVGNEVDAVAEVVANEAVLDCEGKAAVELDPGAADAADSLDRDAAQFDIAGGAAIHRYADGARHQHASFADAVVDDGDGLGDRQGAEAARIEHGDLAVRVGLVVGRLEGTARGRAVAVVGVVADRR